MTENREEAALANDAILAVLCRLATLPMAFLQKSRRPKLRPQFSIVVPTLQRSDTLRHCLKTLVRQDYEDFEIIVQNNGRDPATETCVQQLDDPRVRHFSTNAVLTMTENWETALRNASGEFIALVGDDDG